MLINMDSILSEATTAAFHCHQAKLQCVCTLWSSLHKHERNGSPSLHWCLQHHKEHNFSVLSGSAGDHKLHNKPQTKRQLFKHMSSIWLCSFYLFFTPFCLKASVHFIPAFLQCCQSQTPLQQILQARDKRATWIIWEFLLIRTKKYTQPHQDAASVVYWPFM